MPTSEQQTFYKVLREWEPGKLYSYTHGLEDEPWTIQYKLHEWNYPKLQGSGLYVFWSGMAADRMASGNDYVAKPVWLFECDIAPQSLRFDFCTDFASAYPTFWKDFNWGTGIHTGQKEGRAYGVGNTPAHSYITRAVYLLRPLQMYLANRSVPIKMEDLERIGWYW